MKLLVYGLNFSPELTGIGKYSGEMAEWFSDNNQMVKVITAPPYYPEWKIHKGYSAWKYTVTNDKFEVIRCPLYVPQKINTLNRLLHLISFSLSSLKPLIKQRKWKPDYIICVVPTLFTVPGVLILRKLTGAKVILHVQDYEVDAMVGLGLAKNRFFGSLARKFERWCLTSVDKVSTISNSMMRKALEKKVHPGNIIFFPNWSEVSRFKNIDEVDVINIKNRLDLPEYKKLILYSGNIGEKQGLEIIVDVAEKFKDKPYLFLFVGQGGGRQRLESIVSEHKLKNVLFRPLQPYADLPALLKLADCHLVIQKRGAADAVLPSKLTNILAVGGNSVITAEVGTELGQLCIDYPGIAICVEPESKDAIYQGIEKCLALPLENVVAKQYAAENLDIDCVLPKFIDVLHQA
ncbi:WcaI family glycosyltransferase [Klebsiella quasipneumoniae]|uniref:Glycosyl transferase n=1 Tax=Klebsiella pneumoniae TaxID=573 RepID=X2GTW8_KLEPN|nr:glycosyl transferase [Klebsiella pneumoniae]HBQ8785575.1 WcaI family glycosyltransferase [Klebsiella quasipneumoniae]